LAKHLVTGGSGFLGNLIARRLLNAGEEVAVLDKWQDPTQPKEIRFIEADIRDESNVRRAMKGMNYIHHNVALVPLTKSGKDFWDVNVNGSEIASRIARESGVDNFIHMSSSAIYGAPQQQPITSTTPLKPIEIYGRGKLAGERAVAKNLSDGETNLVVIRPRTILGPGRLGIFQILFEWIQSNRNIYTIGGGENLFQFIHAHDLMDAYMIAISQDRSLTLNVGTTEFSSLNDALSNLISFAGSTSKIRHLPVTPTITALKMADKLKISPLAPWHYLTYHKPFYFDTAPLVELGWRSNYSNDSMLKEAYSDFLKNPDGGLSNESPHRKALHGRILNVVKRFS